MANRDKLLIESVVDHMPKLAQTYLDEAGLDGRIIEHPLDKDVEERLKGFGIEADGDDYRIFNYISDIKAFWKLIIEKSIKCLRFFDKREPYIKNQSKHPIAYGVNELKDYFEKYTQFESMLYGGGKYYRDHVVHVFRVWLLGLDCLLENKGIYLSRIQIQEDVSINSLEKLSIWSMIALTHDLGYPLEKSQGIIEKTKEMMGSFISNPTVSMDLSFNGIQNNMNDFIVRFMSSKMRKATNNGADNSQNSEIKQYVARLQPKYYFKFQKSLEGYKHGILSAIIIYKLLVYFLESDFSINEDYTFNEEDRRQFYIRREILRAISAHTCHDVYHLDMLNFSFLLIMMDDAQEWGRKRISELYVKQKSSYEFKSIAPYFDTKASSHNEELRIHKFAVHEKFTFPDGELDNLKGLLSSLMKQSKGYEEIFRDGQDTAKRNFIFEKQCEVIYEKNKAVTFYVKFVISNEEKPSFEVTVKSANEADIKLDFDADFFRKVYADCKISATDDIEGASPVDKATYKIETKNEFS